MFHDGTELLKLVYFDYSACIVLAMILVSTVMRKMTKGRLNLLFIALSVTAFIASAADCYAVRHDNMLYDNIAVRMIEHEVYLLFHIVTTPLFCMYATELTDTRHLVRRHPVLRHLLSLPLIAAAGALLINPINKKTFYFDETMHYARGEWFWLLYVVAAVYICYLIFFLFRFKRSVGVARWVSLLILLVCMLGAIVLQMFFPRYPVEMFATAVGLLFISAMVQRPEEIMDVESGAKSRSAFAEDMQRSYDNHKAFDIIILKESNLHSFGDLLSYEERIKLLRRTIENVSKLSQQTGVYCEVYYLRGGVFALTLDDVYREQSMELAHALNKEMKLPIKVSSMHINLITYVCLIHCPEDLGSKTALFDFINKAIPADDEVTLAEDILSSGRYDMLIDMESIIGRAVSENTLEVYYQPIYSINEKRFTSAEALIRLKDEKYGFVPPDLFIPEAEKNGQIHKIGRFVFESVCDLIASDEFSELGLDYIEINLSVVECMRDTLADDIISTLERFGISHDRINLEITETFAAKSQSVMEANIRKLTEAGITFSLDDFGTGYSNMQSIALLPLTITKLDKTFASLEDNKKMTVVVEHSIDLIKALQMKIVVEGVETKEMLERFSQLGCEYIQGYYFSKPLPREDFIKFITERNQVPQG
ncbi:EAL domain-containing protein [Ruminococcus sp. NK3A76]|uniref:EAL domain-containing protein n=1 Tax=Ruminococcus sp. NK3A76 TaxID=877411 RepID=UPI0006904910|nr:EAL domain-containing protein [Ruminococcus sp. NK3A76]